MLIKLLEVYPSSFYDEEDEYKWSSKSSTDWEECSEEDYNILLKYIDIFNNKHRWHDDRKLVILMDRKPFNKNLDEYKEIAKELEKNRQEEEKREMEKKRLRTEKMKKKKEEKERKKLAELQNKYNCT